MACSCPEGASHGVSPSAGGVQRGASKCLAPNNVMLAGELPGPTCGSGRRAK